MVPANHSLAFRAQYVPNVLANVADAAARRIGKPVSIMLLVRCGMVVMGLSAGQ